MVTGGMVDGLGFLVSVSGKLRKAALVFQVHAFVISKAVLLRLQDRCCQFLSGRVEQGPTSDALQTSFRLPGVSKT
jgi:hypothetical protein